MKEVRRWTAIVLIWLFLPVVMPIVGLLAGFFLQFLLARATVTFIKGWKGQNGNPDQKKH
jgi:hypothetical protein